MKKKQVTVTLRGGEITNISVTDSDIEIFIIDEDFNVSYKSEPDLVTTQAVQNALKEMNWRRD